MRHFRVLRLALEALLAAAAEKALRRIKRVAAIAILNGIRVPAKKERLTSRSRR